MNSYKNIILHFKLISLRKIISYSTIFLFKIFIFCKFLAIKYFNLNSLSLLLIGILVLNTEIIIMNISSEYNEFNHPLFMKNHVLLDNSIN